MEEQSFEDRLRKQKMGFKRKNVTDRAQSVANEKNKKGINGLI